MNVAELVKTARAMVAPGKGILAMDESTQTCGKRLQKAGVESTPESRRAYRDLLVTTPGVSEFVSGTILYDETMRQEALDGTPFPKRIAGAGMIPGIKVDIGATDLAGYPGEKVTEGLDGLRERLAEYRVMGARFTKWRAVITIGEGIPSRGCIEANAHALARYAALAQEVDLVPIVEPEVLIDGDHTIERCYEATSWTLREAFAQLYVQRVVLEGTVLKPSMVTSGLQCRKQASVEEVARQTVRCLLNQVPAAVAGVAFLSGGQSGERATAHLNAMHRLEQELPWRLTFSYARALQGPALERWKGKTENVQAAQKLLYRRAKLNGAATQGKYRPEMEKEAASYEG